MDVRHGDDGVDVDAELLLDLHDGGLAGMLADLAAVDRDEHIRDAHLGSGLQDRNGLAHSGAGGDDVLDDDDAVAVLRLVADQGTAFAVVLGLLAVEEVGLVDVKVAGERPCCGGDQRDALVGRAEHRVEVIPAVVHDALGIELAEGRDLRAGSVVAGVDKVRGEATALGGELAKAQHVGAHHKFDKFFLCWRNHLHNILSCLVL